MFLSKFSENLKTTFSVEYSWDVYIDIPVDEAFDVYYL